MVIIKIPLKVLPLKVETTGFEHNSTRGDDAIEEYLVTTDPLKPVKLTTSLNDYAGRIEFGMLPDDEPLNKEELKALEVWVRDKAGVTSQSEILARTKQIAQKYKSFGMIPRPWFRPAIHSVFDNLEAEFDNGRRSLYDLAVEMKERAQDNLETLQINYTRALHNSLTVEYLNEEEYRRVMDGTLHQNVIDENWKKYRKQTEVIPNDGDKTDDKRKAEWQA